MVTSLAEVWIEMVLPGFRQVHPLPSLPLRKCGLKFKRSFEIARLRWSLPLRKCGLKSIICKKMKIGMMSLPLRKCGLK